MKINGLDGEVGHVDEVLFDDQHWTVRYLIVDTGNWLNSRKVLISPLSFGVPDWYEHTLNVNLTLKQVENSPDVDTDKPVSRQWEIQHNGYYGWPYYWGGMGTWGTYWYPGALLTHSVVEAEAADQKATDQKHANDDVHLRSTKAVTGYGITATDGHIGKIDNFMVDDKSWKVRYLAVDTRRWWPGKRVLLPPDWISSVNWPLDTVTVDVTREQIKCAPEWDGSEPVTSELEDRLNQYYSRPTHGVNDGAGKTDNSIETVCVS